MGAFASLIFFAFIIFLSVLGLLALIAGISLFIAFSVRKKPKKQKISIIFLSIGIVLIFPIACISISNAFKNIEYKNANKDTGVIIQIEDYNAKELELDGNTYVRLGDYLKNVKTLNPITDIDKKAIANVHITENNAMQNQNFISKVANFFFPRENDIYRLYTLGDTQNKDLLYSEFGGIWCSSKHLEQAILYYDNIENYHCFYMNTADSSKTDISIDTATYNKILSVIKRAYTTTNKETIRVLDDTIFVDLRAQSENGLLQFVLKKDLLVNGDTVFCTTDRILNDNGEEYYKGLKLPVEYK